MRIDFMQRLFISVAMLQFSLSVATGTLQGATGNQTSLQGI